jgi:hypothetical protein
LGYIGLPVPDGWRRVYLFDGGGKACKLTVMGMKNKTTGLIPVKLMRVPLSNLAIERRTFRIPPADGT